MAPKNQESEEYTNDPTKFVPIKKTNKKGKKEIIPWNIACVAGNPIENKYKGKNIKIAVIDSGIDTHDELKIEKWVDFSDEVKGYKPTDNSGHGTEIAGVIGARLNGIGMVGIADEAELYSVKVLNKENRAAVSTIVKAIEWCISNDIDVINMSFGTNKYSKILEDVIKKAYDENITLVASAGNISGYVQYPAAFSEVISVGSIDKDLKTSEMSKETVVDVVAPGEEVNTTGFLGSYSTSSGTSIAAAHVSGLIACMKSAKKKITNAELMSVLKKSSVELEEGNRLINYQNAIEVLMENSKKNKNTIQSKEIINSIVKEQCDQEVLGSWSKSKWIDGSETSGHYSIINNMDLSYFSIGASNDTQKIHNRWIVADSIYRTDAIEQLSASGIGNYNRNSNGQVTTSTPKMYSPYHAKGEYSLSDITASHLQFLYELARRRLVKGSSFDLTATNYTGNTYYSVPIPEKMKRRIIVDLNVLNDNLISQYSGSSVDFSTTTAKGYMILGVFLHLVQDLQAHRAVVKKNMLWSTSDGTTYYPYDVFTNDLENSRINCNNIKGFPDDSSVYWDLYNDINDRGSIPMIKLKTYLKSTIAINCNGQQYSCSGAAAYEDNPYFFRNRFVTASNFSVAYINRMLNDTENISTQINYYYADNSVPLFNGVHYGYNN